VALRCRSSWCIAVALIAVALIAGCGSVRRSAGGDDRERDGASGVEDSGADEGALADSGGVDPDVTVDAGPACKRAVDPRVSWFVRLRGSGALAVTAVGVAKDGSAAVTGGFAGALGDDDGTTLATARGADPTFATDLFVWRLDADGTSPGLFSAGGATMSPGRVAMLADGRHVVGAAFAGTGEYGSGAWPLDPGGLGIEGLVAWHAPDGTVTGVTTLGGAASTARVRSAIALAAGGVAVAGDFDARGYLAVLDATGEVVWERRPLGDRVTDVVAASGGGLLAVGHYTRNATFGMGEPEETTLRESSHGQSFVGRWNEDGSLAWARNVPFVDSPNEVVRVVPWPDGSFVLTGQQRGSTPTTSETPFGWFGRFDSTGERLWGFRAGISTVRAADVAPDGSVLVAGSLDGPSGALRPDGLGADTQVDGILGPSDGFVARLSEAGDVEAVMLVGGNSSDAVADVRALPDGSAIVAGTSGEAIEQCPAGVLPWPADEVSAFAGRVMP
jgi:hypothetical protein